MEILFEQSKVLIAHTALDFIRDFIRVVHWEERLVVIRGARGVGKTTLMLQHMKLHYGVSDEALYITLDDFYFTEHRLVDTARKFVQLGGKVMYIDEVHRYPHGTWAQEIKNIYDLIPDLKLVLSGSSVMEFHAKQADLSRRAVVYELSGLTYREFLTMTNGQPLPSFSLEDILQRPQQVAETVIHDYRLRPLAMLGVYLKEGYYPFYRESKQTYSIRLLEMMKTVIESDFHFLQDYTITDHSNLSRLLYVISGSVPFKPNISKLSERIGLNRNRLVQYIYLLERARLLNLLHSDRHGITALQKPDKIYMENTNLMHALSPTGIEKGHEIETFVLNQLHACIRSRHMEVSIHYPEQGDFLLEGLPGGSVTLEVGGAGKSGAQIQNTPGGMVVRDDIEFGSDRVVPLWMFGFLQHGL